MDSCSSDRCVSRCGSNRLDIGWWVGWCSSDRCSIWCGNNRLDIEWWVRWWVPTLDTSYVKCCRLIFFISKIVPSFNFGAPWLWRGDVQHNSIVPFGLSIAPEAAFTFSMTLDMLHQILDKASNLLPFVSFWKI